MIRYIDNNTAIPFIYWPTGGGTPFYGSGSVATASLVAGSIVGFGRISGSVQTYSTTSAYWKAIARIFGSASGSSQVSAYWRAVAKISGSINTFSTVVGDMNKKLIIEILRFTSKVTKFIKFK